MRNKTLTCIIIATLLCAFLTFTVGKVTRVSALAVGPLADPVYDTEIIAFKDYVEQNLDAPQLDIMFFLIGGLAVAQMGAQDAMLISPYPNEESVKEWIINCGIQLYNSVIGLVPEGDYYMGIPSIGTSGTKGVPRQVIKGLVAQMMGDAIVAINYPDLDIFLEENPDQILLPFNADLQLGVNAVFGLHGGLYDWQFNRSPFTTSVVYKSKAMSAPMQTSYFDYLNSQSYTPIVRFNVYGDNGTYFNGRIRGQLFSQYRNIFINTNNHYYYFYDNNGNVAPPTESYSPTYPNVYVYYDEYVSSRPNINTGSKLTTYYLNPKNINNYAFFSNFRDMVQSIYNGSYIGNNNFLFFEDFIEHVYIGSSWSDKVEIFNDTDLSVSDVMNQYYQQVENDYLFDLRGLMGDLVNYVYLNPIWDNIYDIIGTLVTPDRVNVSVDLTPITDLLAPPIPVNMNDIALYTENNYLEKLKEHAKNYGDTLGEYFVFWHNSDPELVYVMFGSFIVILLGLFVGTWRHS